MSDQEKEKTNKKIRVAFMLQHQTILKLEELLRLRHKHQDLYNQIMEEDRNENSSSSRQK